MGGGAAAYEFLHAAVHRQEGEEEEEESDVWAHAVSERDGVAIL